MGLFLATSGIVGAGKAEVIAALAAYTAACGGIFQAEARSTDEDDTLVLCSVDGNTTLLFPSNFMLWWETSQALSERLKRPVFAFHIHDEDLWMYQLYRDGIHIDAFNPIPDYWSGDIDEQEREANQGNAQVVCECIPGLDPRQIEKYLVTWDEDVEGKAYPEDKFPYGSDWQMVDFMKKLKLTYPMDDKGQPLGPTYHFHIPD